MVIPAVANGVVVNVALNLVPFVPEYNSPGAGLTIICISSIEAGGCVPMLLSFSQENTILTFDAVKTEALTDTAA